jgi:hypothetical protein
MPQRRYDVPWSWETLTLVQALRPIAVFLDIKQLPAHFPKAKRLHVALGDNLPRLREWFRAFYHKPEMADQMAVWGSPQQIADQIVRLKKPA